MMAEASSGKIRHDLYCKWNEDPVQQCAECKVFFYSSSVQHAKGCSVRLEAHNERQRIAREKKQKKIERLKAEGKIPLSYQERLIAAMKPVLERGASKEEVHELVMASYNAFRQGVGIGFPQFEADLDALYAARMAPETIIEVAGKVL
jgi:hypothetical protein